ncbi:hypothetical protein P171DRAFT_449460 [Karstenula rhodostoma CBS 690.94]|uniref:Uncharacterized protein n=1 Tax=Karstenula rhodostoma CBS 690.94 TaxID=1392251 RepID=A0A9P4P4L8_9PLEO|nr:hypothetical protein P171DRAFT_449460 [Karstenula rhodostoma CBS 690.94]
MEEYKVRDETLRNILVARRREFLATTISHSQTYCRSLSERIVRSLPREVRDMIYVYLCDRIPRVIIRPVEDRRYANYRGSGSIQAEAARWTPIQRIKTPLFSLKYLHKDFLFELAASLYQTATFHIWDADDLFDFLNQDLLHVGCIPKDHIRKLSLVIFTDEENERCRSKRQIREKVAKLTHLFDIRHRRGFHLDLHLCIDRKKRLPFVARFHQLLLPHLRSLLAAGFAMRFPRVKVYYYMHRRGIDSCANQLQASDSRDPADWVVDAAELDAWSESEYVRGAFLKKARYHRDYLADSEDDLYESEGDEWDDGDVPEDVVDGEAEVDSDDEGWYSNINNEGSYRSD